MPKHTVGSHSTGVTAMESAVGLSWWLKWQRKQLRKHWRPQADSSGPSELTAIQRRRTERLPSKTGTLRHTLMQMHEIQLGDRTHSFGGSFELLRGCTVCLPKLLQIWQLITACAPGSIDPLVLQYLFPAHAEMLKRCKRAKMLKQYWNLAALMLWNKRSTRVHSAALPCKLH